MASEKSIPIVTMLTISLLMMMYSTDVAIASMSLCELQCSAACRGMGAQYKTCFRSCCLQRCGPRVLPTLDPPYNPFSDRQIPCKLDCVSSKCMDGRSDAEKTAGCVTSCAAECDNRKN